MKVNKQLNIIDVCSITRQICEQMNGERYAVIYETVELMESGIFDITTYDLMKEYLKDEEEDMYWSEGQLELIEKIGIQNYLNNQWYK